MSEWTLGLGMLNKELAYTILGIVFGTFLIAYAIFLGTLINVGQSLSFTDALQSGTILILAITLIWSIMHQRQKERF